MYMKESEIVREFREGKDKKQQVKILADMNGCSYDEIVEVLRKQGIDVSGVERKKRGRQSIKEKETLVPAEEKKSDMAAGVPAETIKPAMAAGLPDIVRETITQRMMAETEKMEMCASLMKECEQNIKELNAFLQARG